MFSKNDKENLPTHWLRSEQSYLEPRRSANYQTSDRIRIKAAWGKYYQFVTRTVREDVTEGSRDFWLVANG